MESACNSEWWMDDAPLDGAFHALLLVEACALSAVGHRSHLQSIMDANVFSGHSRGKGGRHNLVSSWCKSMDTEENSVEPQFMIERDVSSLWVKNLQW